jgi:hypothetical protein
MAKKKTRKRATARKAVRKAAKSAARRHAAPTKKPARPVKAGPAAEPLVLYDLGPSPNSMKVRVTLGYKGLPYRKIAVNSGNRAPVIKVSRQPLTPVLLHGGRAVYDSAGILRYLDANFPQAPSIFSMD